MPDISDEALGRAQFHRLHEDLMRAEGFEGWAWPDPPTGRAADADLFERWVIARWLAHIRSPEYRGSADYWFLRAEWERNP